MVQYYVLHTSITRLALPVRVEGNDLEYLVKIWQLTAPPVSLDIEGVEGRYFTAPIGFTSFDGLAPNKSVLLHANNDNLRCYPVADESAVQMSIIRRSPADVLGLALRYNDLSCSTKGFLGDRTTRGHYFNSTTRPSDDIRESSTYTIDRW